jgi:hypothetical protein
MLIVRMARPVHHMTLRRKKPHVITGSRNPDFVSRIKAETRHLGEPLFSSEDPFTAGDGVS